MEKREAKSLDDARQPRGIYFVDPDDEEYKEILKRARRKLEIPMAPTMPCKRMVHTSTTKVAAKQEITHPERFQRPLVVV